MVRGVSVLGSLDQILGSKEEDRWHHWGEGAFLGLLRHLHKHVFRIRLAFVPMRSATLLRLITLRITRMVIQSQQLFFMIARKPSEENTPMSKSRTIFPFIQSIMSNASEPGMVISSACQRK